MKSYKRIMGLCMAAALLFTAGCGQGAGAAADGAKDQDAPGTAAENVQKEASDSGEPAKNSDGEKAMGRYVETIYELPTDRSRIGCIARMEDGSLRLFDYNNGLWVSKDDGVTWELEPTAWCERLVTQDTYILDVAIAPDGSVAVAYEPSGGQAESGEDADVSGGKQTEGEDGEGQAEPDKEDGVQEEAAFAEEDPDGDSYMLHPLYLLIAPDGTEKELTLPKEEQSYVLRFCFSDTGKLFASALGGSFYEIDQATGKSRLLFTNDGYAHNMTVRGDLMVYTDSRGFGLYDLGKEEALEDETLKEFSASALGGEMFSGSTEGVVDIDLFLEEDRVLYLICSQGIYRHVVDGSRIEQVMDGSITSLDNPVNGIVDMTMLTDERFLVAFTGGRVMLYSYDPQIPTVPELAVKVYSLEENDMLKQAIALYRNRHPESYVQYDTGLTSGSPVTREDALKKLNTEIVAGKGPDLLLLDDMPIASYMEKGILADLTPYLTGAADSLLPAALSAFSSGDAVYAVPAQFRIPLLAGDKKATDAVTDLASLAEQLEILRKEKPQGSLLGAWTEETLLTMLLPVCAPAWKTKEGELDKEALKEFLIQAERIWKAESAGHIAETREKYEESIQRLSTAGIPGYTKEDWMQSLGSLVLDCQTGRLVLAMGLLDGNWTFANLISTFRLEQFADGDFNEMNGQVSHVYTPETVMGISAGSSRADAAGELLQLLLNGTEISWYNALPMNRDCLAQETVNTYTDSDSLGSVSMTSDDEDEAPFSIDLYWPTEADFAKLKQYVEEMAVPYIRDAVLEDAVVKSGQKVLTGELSPEEGVRAIEKDTAIYLAE